MNRTRKCLLILGLAALAGPGCGRSARPADPDQGSQALRVVLDAWKGGARPEAFSTQTPNIHASDGDWMAGLALQDYRTEGEARLVGTDLNYAVVLELKNPRGRVVRKHAVYAVTTHPRVLVLRQDD